MVIHQKFYQVALKQISPGLFALKDQPAVSILKQYNKPDKIAMLLKHIKKHMPDSTVNNSDPASPIFAESTILLMASPNNFKTFDAGLSKLIGNENKAFHGKSLTTIKKTMPFDYDIRATYEVNHARRVLILILRSAIAAILERKDPQPVLKCIPTLVAHDMLFKWLFNVTHKDNNYSALNKFNTFETIKFGIQMLNNLNVFYPRMDMVNLPFTYAQRNEVSRELFQNGFNASFTVA